MDVVSRTFTKDRGGYNQRFEYTTFDIIFLEKDGVLGNLISHLRNAFIKGIPIYDRFESPSEAKSPLPKEVALVKSELTKLAKAVPTPRNRNDRHAALAKFFIENDSQTIGTEVPVWLSEKESPNGIPWYGYIDVVRFGEQRVIVADYKPEIPNSSIQKFGVQVLRYMYMLSVRTGIPLGSIDGVFFNDKVTYQVTPKNYE